MPATTATTGIIYAGANRFIHNYGTSSTFVGVGAGNLTFTGTGLNTAVGTSALGSLTSGAQNTAVGQGALGIEIRADRLDLLTILAPLNHPATASCVEAERGMSRALSGSCTVPLGAYAVREGDILHMTGFVASIDGSQVLREAVSGSASEPETLGKALAAKLIAQCADKILTALDEPHPK